VLAVAEITTGGIKIGDFEQLKCAEHGSILLPSPPVACS
jgi:hypothetical protein